MLNDYGQMNRIMYVRRPAHSHDFAAERQNMRSEQQVNTAIEQYADTVLRVCTVYLKNHTDTEDIFQTVFLKYASDSTVFLSPEHEKAWIIRVTINACKDLLKSVFRRRTVPLNDEIELYSHPPEPPGPVTEAVLRLPRKYMEVVYLHYYEGYTIPEIAKLLGKNPNTVYTNLHRAKDRLKNVLEEESYGS